MNILAALLAGVLAMVAMPAAAAAEPGLDARFTRMLDEEGLQGMVWSLRIADGTQTGAAGVRDAATGEAMRIDDHVQVGSIAKTVLALGILRLVSEQRVDLDAPLGTLLPDVAFDNPWHAQDPVRVRHLLDHTAGIDDARLGQVFSARARADAPLADALADWPGVLRVRSRPGTRTSYSNTGYTVLGMLVERVTGERYEHWLDANVLRRLGLLDSTVGFTTQHGAAADARLAMGHFENAVRQAAVPSFVRPAAQLTTTASDMARLAGFLLGDGRIDGDAFIDTPLLRAIGEPSGTLASDAGLRVGYALGMAARDRHGIVGRCHGGSTVGFRALLCIYPDVRGAFFAAWNTDSESANHARFEATLVEALGATVGERPAIVASAVDHGAWNGYYVPSPNRFAALAWIDTLSGFIDVRANGRGIRLTPFAARPVELDAVGANLLRAPGRVMASHALVIDEGNRVIATGTQNYQRVPAWRLAGLWSSLGLFAAGMLWLLLRGSVSALRRRLGWRDAVFVPWLGVVAVLLSLPMFFTQSVLIVGDRTPASISLAIASALLPVAMLVGLVRAARGHASARVDVIAMLAVLQGVLVLASWGLWPLRTWA